MFPIELSRRSFVATAGAAALAVPALAQANGSFLPPARAADIPAGETPEGIHQLQQDFVDMRFGMFLHFSLGTFTDEEWAAPNQPPTTFAPTGIDCAQWAAAAKAAKMQYGVLTTKHHDGFSLWPTTQGTQNVMYSSFKKDIVKEYVDAFRAEGLKVGFYFSIWDRTAGIEAYGRHVDDQTKSIEPADMDVILTQLTELLTNYGQIDLLMTDGYTWQAGQQQVSYARVRDHVKSLQPNCLLTDICAVTEPWLGDLIFWEEPLGPRVPKGNTHAGLQGQTISNGWFWHPHTPWQDPMSVQSILEHFEETEPNYTSFILNCPPNRDGRLDDNIVARLAEVGAAWAGPDMSRPPLPDQGENVLWPVVPVAAFASQFNTNWGANENPYRAIDGRGDMNFETCWSTWGPNTAGSLPATLVVDLGGVWDGLTHFQYLPKQWGRNGTDGDILSATISLSVDGSTWEKVADVTWTAGKPPKSVVWSERSAAYLKIDVLQATGGYVNVNGLKIGGRATRPKRLSHPLVGKKIQIMDAGGRALTSTDTGVTLATATAGASDWRVIEAEDNYVFLQNVKTALALSLDGTDRDAGADVDLSPQKRDFAEHWALSQLDENAWALTNRFNMLTLAAAAAPANDLSLQDALLDKADRQWQLVVIDEPTPTPTPTASATPTPTATPTASPTPTATSTPTPSPSPSATSTPTPSPWPTMTPAPSATPTASASPTPSWWPTATPTPSASPSVGGILGSGSGSAGGKAGALAVTGATGPDARVGLFAGAAALLGGALVWRNRRQARSETAEPDSATDSHES